MAETAQQSIDRYTHRRDQAAAEHQCLSRTASRISNLRLLAFAAIIGALVWAELQPELGGVAFTLVVLAALAFFGLIAAHSRITRRARHAEERAAVNAEGIARIDRDWDALPDGQEPPRGHPYARDLDIMGHGSLARLLPTGTGAGRARLREWLLGGRAVSEDDAGTVGSAAPVDESAAPKSGDAAVVGEARRRQEAVRELVPALDFRQDLLVTGRLSGDPDRAALDAFLDWADDEPWLLRRPLVLWTARLIPVATLTFAVLHLQGTFQRPWWLLTLLAGVLFSSAFSKRVHSLFDRASLGDLGLRHYAGIVGLIQGSEFQAPALRDHRAALLDPTDARDELETLSWQTELTALRHNGMFYILLHWPTLWDFHVLWALERWQRRAGAGARRWVEAVAEIDALAALATPADEEPGWVFPTLDEHGDTFDATGLAHPLLRRDERVPNDIAVGPPGTFVMVTGSNMSGKSTLLRAIGINAVLALAGGPVCAGRLTTPAVAVFTSMRIEDSLERGVSLFMAELQRLKQVVDAAADPGPRLLYLLDEILHGTNSAERQVAVREVLTHLLESRAIGAISTHDLELSSAQPLAGAVHSVHFQETVHPDGHEPPMTFDYQLRDGIATSTNALKLVRLVGLA